LSRDSEQLSRGSQPVDPVSPVPADHTAGGTGQPSGRKSLNAASLALLLFAVGSAACGQLLLKSGMTGATTRSQAGGKSLAISAATTPLVWLGLFVFGISALAWLTTLSKVPLSVAYPFNALGFLAILTTSALILHERTNIWTWVGTGTVVVGIILVVTTRPS
jgi:multidrug transporter EmrE-like cation transporter